MLGIPSSLPVIQRWVSSSRNKLGRLAVVNTSTVTRYSERKTPTLRLRTFSHSSKTQQQHQQHRHRIILRSAENKPSYGRSGGNHYREGRRQHQQQIPPYVYFMGGIPIVGGLYFYFRFQDLAPLTGRRRWLATDPGYENTMGDKNYRQLLVQYKNNILPQHHPATILVKRAGKRIFLAAGKFAEQNGLESSFDRKKVTFTVVASEQANAFVLPGNHVFFLTGMFKYAKTEDEIACILGHEMAHNLARHHGENMSSGVVVSAIAYLSLLVDPSGTFLTFFFPAAKLLSELPNSRHQESEADFIGMRLAAEACYDAEALSRVFRRMHMAGQEGKDKNIANNPPEFLSTHPSNVSRIRDMQKWLQEDKKTFDMHDGERCRAFRREMQKASDYSGAFRQSNRISAASVQATCPN